jgi:DNA-binding MarR family transcriptional regulator
MELDNRLLLPLLAVRMLGGRSVPEDDAALKELKKSLAEVVAKGWVQKQTVKLADPTKLTKKGAPSTKSQKVVHLTEEGEKVLREAAHPETLAATSAGVVVGLRESLEADRQALREQVIAALSPKEDNKLRQELSKLSKAVEGLAEKVEKLESLVADPGSADHLLARIDQAFAALSTRVDGTLKVFPATSPPVHPPRPAHVSPPPAAVREPVSGEHETAESATPQSVRTVLHNAYERLCHFREFEDGLVELPRLYHEARKKLPGLTVEEFHRELDDLWSKRDVELHIINEVQRASEPEKGIRRDDYLYYYVYWNRP